MGESLVRMPQSEVTATLERLTALKVESDDLKRLRETGAAARFRAEIISQQLGIKHASFLTPPNGSHDREELIARWGLINEQLLKTANSLHHMKKTSSPFKAFEMIVDQCHKFYQYEFLIWQVVCETMYQIAMGGGSAEKVRRVISSMEYRQEFKIGCHRFHYILPEEFRPNFGDFHVIPRSENNCYGIKEALWPRMRMRTLQLIINRYIYLME